MCSEKHLPDAPSFSRPVMSSGSMMASPERAYATHVVDLEVKVVLLLLSLYGGWRCGAPAQPSEDLLEANTVNYRTNVN
jgi:hypothetical protein